MKEDIYKNFQGLKQIDRKARSIYKKFQGFKRIDRKAGSENALHLTFNMF